MKKIFTGFLLLVLISCNNNSTAKPIVKQENGNDDVYNVAGDDEMMNQAIEKAVSSYDSFLNNFKNPGKDCNGFSIKMKFPYNNGNEHMWLGDLFYKGDKLMGVLDSDPVNPMAVHAGDTVEVERDKVSDWMYICNHKLVGGYTMMVLYSKMSPAEKEEFKKNLGFDIE